MFLPPLASPGNIDWRLIVPNQQSVGVGAWQSIIKPGNGAWLYIYMVGAGSGGSGGATRASGVAGAGGGGGGSGISVCFMIPWFTLPDVIYAYPGLGGAAGGANLANGGAGGQSVIQIEPISAANSSYYVANASGGLAPSGATGANGGVVTSSGFPYGIGPGTQYNGTGGASGVSAAKGNNMNSPATGRFSGGAGGGGCNTSNTGFVGGGLFPLFNLGPGQIIGSTSGSGGDGGGVVGGGAGTPGNQLGQGPSTPLALFLMTGCSRPVFFTGGCGGGGNGSGTGGVGGQGDWGCGGGGGGAGTTGGVGGKGGDGFIIIGNF